MIDGFYFVCLSVRFVVFSCWEIFVTAMPTPELYILQIILVLDHFLEIHI